MTKSSLIRRLAREAGLSAGDAADQLDALVTRISHTMRQGKTARIPGFGTFSNGDTRVARTLGLRRDR